MANGESGISLWGDQFVARIDFTKALADSQRLDQNIRAAEASLDRFVSRGTSRLAALAAGFDRVAASAARASAGMGAGAAAGATGIGVLGGSAAGATVVGRPERTGRISHPQPGIFDAGRTQAPRTDWVRYAGPVTDRLGGAPINQSNAEVLRRMGLLNDWRVQPPFGGGGGTYSSGRMGQNWRYWGTSGPPVPYNPGTPVNFTRGPAGALPPPPPIDVPFRSVGGGGMGGGGMRGGRMGPSTNLMPFYMARGSTEALSGVGGMSRIFSWQNMIRAATGLYIGQALGYGAAAVGQGTVGQAAQEQEARELLGVTLTSPSLGIDTDEARMFADQLVDSRYLAGISTSAVGLGLSRTEIAEQYRMLAPLVRLSAEDSSQFTSGLQRGTLARQLLTARDPVQGTRGAMVALSELYAGGPDRFRSLALRFELPRSRLLEIEQELESQGGAYDPADIAIQVLSEMGMGEEYIERRARGTLQGQLARTGALFDNTRIDLFQGSLDTLITNFDRFNNAVEAWANSPAYDQLIERLDGIFGRIFEFATNPITDWVSGNLFRMGGRQDAFSAGSGAFDFMRYAGGEFRDSLGNVVETSESFSEAMTEVTENHLRALMYSSQYDSGAAAARESALWSVGALGAGAAADRWLFNGQGRTAMRRGGWMAAMRASPAARAIPALGVAFTIGSGIASVRSAGQSMETLENVDALGYDLGLDTSMFGGSLDSERIAGIAQRLQGGNAIQRAAGRSALITSEIGTQVGNLFGLAPLLGAWDLQSAGEVIAERSTVPGAAQAINSYLLASQDDPTSLTPERRMRLARDYLERMRQQDPENYRYTVAQENQIIQSVGAAEGNVNENFARVSTAAAIQESLVMGRGYEVETPGGRMLGFSRDEIDQYLDDPEAQRGLLSEFMAAFEGRYGILHQDNLEQIEELKNIGSGVEETAENTSASGFTRTQLSSMPGLFYGYNPDPDMRNVMPGHGIRPEGTPSGAFGGLGATFITSRPGQEYAEGGPYAGQQHNGFDFAIGMRGVGGDEVYNPFQAGAEVVDKGFNAQGLGNYVHLRTHTGRIVRMGHFKEEVPWDVGDTVPHGEVIGLEGSTGISTGPHLHADYLGDGKENRDAALFREKWIEDTGLPDTAMGQGGPAPEPMQVEFNIDVSGVSGDPGEIAAAVRTEFERMVRDGQFTQAVSRVTALKRRQGGPSNGTP